MLDRTDILKPLLQKLERLGKLGYDDVAAIRKLSFAIKRVKAGDFIARQGESCSYCTLLVSGIATRDRMTVAGTRQISGFYLPGDLVDMHYVLGGSSLDNVQILDTNEVVQISIDTIDTLIASRPAIARLFWIDALIDASIAREWMLNIGRRNARTRLLHLLCEFAVRQEQAGLGPHDELTIPLTQEQLADTLGLTAVHVNRVLQALRLDPTIERDGRTIKIRDWRTLVKAADFNSAYLSPATCSVRYKKAGGD